MTPTGTGKGTALCRSRRRYLSAGDLRNGRFAEDVLASERLVSVLMVTYRPDEGTFAKCIASVAAQTHRPLELILADNCSHGAVVPKVVESIRSPAGTALNATVSYLALKASQAPRCLVLNPDKELEPRAVSELVAAADSDPDIIGVAPKVKLLAFPSISDSVGIDFAWSGDASQRGLGQIDLGQFDEPEFVPGVTMGASMIRRDAFDETRVGSLDERFFMFFEDVDWSYRAAMQGEVFRSVPSAVVFHFGSASARTKAFNCRRHSKSTLRGYRRGGKWTSTSKPKMPVEICVVALWTSRSAQGERRWDAIEFNLPQTTPRGCGESRTSVYGDRLRRCRSARLRSKGWRP